mgnify:CR=1 FL=1
MVSSAWYVILEVGFMKAAKKENMFTCEGFKIMKKHQKVTKNKKIKTSGVKQLKTIKIKTVKKTLKKQLI